MAKTESFMLVSLEEEKAKRLAQVISNETCTKLLNHLATKGEATESDIAKSLQLPLSTVHYNLKQLVASKLVTADEYHYSEKGREVLHYKLANKYIIIAPQEEKESFLKKLQQFLPAVAVVGVAALALKLVSLFAGTSQAGMIMEAAPAAIPAEAARAAAPLMEKSFEAAADAGTLAFETAVAPAANETLNRTTVVIQNITVQPWITNDMVVAFLVGAAVMLAALVLMLYVKHRRTK